MQTLALRNSKDYEDSVNRYVEPLAQSYNVEHIDFKSDMHPREVILTRINEGYKVISMKRDTVDILKSCSRRIDRSLANASV